MNQLDRRHRERGSTLVLVLFLLILVGALALAMSSSIDMRARASSESVRESQVSYACEGALDFCTAYVWDSFLAASGGEPGSVQEFVNHLETGLTPPLTDGGIIDLTSLAPQLGIPMQSVTLRRQDLSGGLEVELTARAVADFGPNSLMLSRTLRVAGGAYQGLDFGLLSNNVNCIFCHAQIDSVDKYSGSSYERIKVASLESMLVRTTSAESTIAGTLYVMGSLTDKSGTSLSTLEGTTVTGFEYDSAGILTTDPSGGHVATDMIPGQNLYVNDPSVVDDVPDSFPAAFADLNGNRIVDDDEYDAVAAESTGTLSGGVIYEVPLGGALSGGLPTSGTVTSVSGQGSGHTVLVGTAANPIVIDGQVSFPGDVVIEGVVKGGGSIWARGNVYVVGDLTYADGTDATGARTYGVADDGTTNALGLTAGGNIMIGDYLTPKKGDVLDAAARTTGGVESNFSFALSEITLFNRREYTKTQPTLPDGSGGTVANPLYDPNYVPRYYVQNSSSPVGVFINGKTTFDPISGEWGGKEHGGKWADIQIVQPTEMPAGTQLLSLAPTGGWLSEQQLKEIWIADEMARSTGDEFKIDAMLYTDNSIFALTRNRTKSEGRMIINGGLIAADIGLLAAGPKDGRPGLELNYDQRIAQYLGLVDASSSDIRQTGMWRQTSRTVETGP